MRQGSGGPGLRGPNPGGEPTPFRSGPVPRPARPEERRGSRGPASPGPGVGSGVELFPFGAARRPIRSASRSGAGPLPHPRARIAREAKPSAKDRGHLAAGPHVARPRVTARLVPAAIPRAMDRIVPAAEPRPPPGRAAPRGCAGAARRPGTGGSCRTRRRSRRIGSPPAFAGGRPPRRRGAMRRVRCLPSERRRGAAAPARAGPGGFRSAGRRSCSSGRPGGFRTGSRAGGPGCASGRRSRAARPPPPGPPDPPPGA